MILFLIAYILTFPLTIINYFIVWNKGYFRSTAISIDKFANREFRATWNKFLITKQGYKFGNEKETISACIGINKKLNTLTKTGLFLYKLLNFLEKNHCEIAANLLKK